MDEKKLQRSVIIMVSVADFSKVRELLEKEDIDFFVNDPILGVKSISGSRLLKE